MQLYTACKIFIDKRISDRPHATYALSAGMYASQTLPKHFLEHDNVSAILYLQVAHMAFLKTADWYVLLECAQEPLQKGLKLLGQQQGSCTCRPGTEITNEIPED
jgi:hypothetical protein